MADELEKPPRNLEEEIERLWVVIRALKKWHKAAPGREASECEFELINLLEELPKEEK